MSLRRKKHPIDIDVAITEAHTHLKSVTPGSDEETKAVDNLAKLYKMKESLKDPGHRVSKDAIVAAAASVGSVALILIFEGVGRGIITSKSLGFAPKPKNTTPNK